MAFRIFNAAGEKVADVCRHVAVRCPPAGLKVAECALVANRGGRACLTLVGAGVDVCWDGRADTGAFVAAGAYLAQVESRDPFGRVVDITATLQVVADQGLSSLEVYNTAGECVARLPLALDKPDRMVLSADSLALGSGRPLKVDYGPDTADSVAWDGRNAAGQAVEPGTYLLRMQVANREGTLGTRVEQVQVLRPTERLLGRALAAPNPSRGGPVRVWLGGGQLTARAAVYTLDGRRVAALDNRGHPGYLEWPVEGMAGGLYVVQVWAEDARGRRDTWQGKVAVAR